MCVFACELISHAFSFCLICCFVCFILLFIICLLFLLKERERRCGAGKVGISGESEKR